MTTPTTPHPHLQERSRATAARLLDATLELLAETGLEGAVIPAIAARAGVAPASVYRRFTDKDGLLRAAFMQLLNRSKDATREQLAPLLLADTLAATLRNMVGLLRGQYRQHPKLVRGLARYIESDPDSPFAHEARATMRANLDLLVELMLAAHHDDIAHPAPARALQFVAMNASGAIESFELDPHSPMHLGTPMSAEELEEHLVRSAVAYLHAR